jgi:DNA repair protein RecO (recombination protein O)
VLTKCKAIVVKTINYSETSVVLKCYTDLFGIQSYMVNGVRSKKGSIKPSQLMPLTLLEIEAYHQQNKNLQRIKELKCVPQLHSLHFDIVKSSVGIFMAEVMHKCIQEENHADHAMFTFLHSTIQLLDLQPQSVANFPVFFLLHLSKYLGFKPKGQYTEATNGFDFREGVFEQYYSQNPYQLSPELSLIISELLHHAIEEVINIKMDQTSRSVLLNSLIEYFQTHVEGFYEVNSHKILSEVLA